MGKLHSTNRSQTRYPDLLHQTRKIKNSGRGSKSSPRRHHLTVLPTKLTFEEQKKIEKISRFLQSTTLKDDPSNFFLTSEERSQTAPTELLSERLGHLSLANNPSNTQPTEIAVSHLLNSTNGEEFNPPYEDDILASLFYPHEEGASQSFSPTLSAFRTWKAT